MKAKQSAPPLASSPQPEAKPAVWETPRVTRIEAGSAETQSGPAVENDLQS